MQVIGSIKAALRRAAAHFAWRTVECTFAREVERNTLTGECRWRRMVYCEPGVSHVGIWRPGLPIGFELPADNDD
ncbi:hypothetical protein [Methylobacterium dankookense]|uniref:Uncharacterized protein n=1 Tax=Methylobacterium dankookense TaxID=560405 RepID=A0A564G552_9HYPH|nr:hypothetical protein [Methylobacterium dankookense]GJD58707.1 hypothetical protein IFDJLNFL_4630 [Methylobacterium dankookense]VUF15164.1 hypothetical protein MTDSW087_04899 [Methylobacterium dankookense]